MSAGWCSISPLGYRNEYFSFLTESQKVKRPRALPWARLSQFIAVCRAAGNKNCSVKCTLRNH